MPRNSKRLSSAKQMKQEIFANLALSSRRIFHIFTDSELDERESFKDIYFGQWGTGILIKKGMKYFLLTAYHVLKDYLDGPLPNTSPFRVTNLSSSSFNNTQDFLYPKRAWKIGDLIAEHEYYDFKDVVLVELFNPNPGQKIDHYIDVDNVDILKLEEYQDGITLSDSGYSELSNPYHFDGDNDELPFDESKFSTSTTYKRDLIHGVLKKNKYTYHFEKINYLDRNTNGMSGGLIIGCDGTGSSKIVGMHTSGSKDSPIIHFLPICKIFKVVHQYFRAECVVIDYCYFDRLKEQKEDVGGIGSAFSNYADTLPKGSCRSQIKNDNLALLDDMADFAVENKEMILVNALDMDEVKGTKHNYLNMLTLIMTMAVHRNDRIKVGRP